MRKKIIFTCLATLLICTCFAQVYVAKTAIFYPRTDSAFPMEAHLTISINQEAGTVQITVKNWGNESPMLYNDTTILELNPSAVGLTMRDGKCSYTIVSMKKNDADTVYYLKEAIYYVSVRPDCIIIAFSKAKNIPIMLTGS